MQIQCRDCNKDFTLTDSEKQFYEKKGFQLPKRCKACRVLNKERKAREGGEY